MDFLNPSLWWAAPLAAAPFILHLLHLRRSRPYRFSNVELLRKVFLRRLPESRLRRWLLLAARCLLLLAALAAFARPVLRGGSGPPEEEGLRLVLLLDASWSMGWTEAGRTRLALAAEAGRRLLGALRPQDRVAVAAFGTEPPELAWASSPEAAVPLLAAPLTNRGSDAGAAVRAAAAFLSREPTARSGIVLLSDGARHAFPGGPPAVEGVSVLALDFKDPAANRTVSAARPEGALQVSAELAGAPGETELRLWLAGRAASARPSRVPGSALLEAAPPPGWAWGKVELREDGLAADDAFHFVHEVRGEPRVVFLSAESDFYEPGRGGRFLRRLFTDPDGALLPYRAEFADLRSAGPESLADADVAVLAAGRETPPAAAQALEAFVRRGGGLLVWLEEGFEAAGPLEPVLAAGVGPDLAPRDPKVRLDEAPDASPWRFDWRDFELEQVEVSRLRALRPGTGASVWMRTGDGLPLLVERRLGEGRSLLWASSLDPARSNLALKPVFVAWLNVVLGRLARREGEEPPLQLAVGERWSAPVPRDPASVVLPDGSRRRLQPQGARVEFAATDAPGVYWYEHGAERRPFAVNLDRSRGEWDLAPADLPYARLDPERPEEGLRARFFGVEARWAFLYGVFFLLGVESLLARRRDED